MHKHQRYLFLTCLYLGIELVLLFSSSHIWACSASKSNLTPCDVNEEVLLPAPANVTDTNDTPLVKHFVPANLHDFVNANLNTMEFKRSKVLLDLLQKWESKDNPRISIAHFGDSHIQGGYAVESARHRLQQLRGSAGRGMVFPYAIAKTYSQNDFKSSFQGEWSTANSIQINPRLPLGISGFVARTQQTKTEFQLNFANPFDPGVKNIRLMFRVSHPNYEITVRSGSLSQHKNLQEAFTKGEAIVEFEFSELAQDVHFEISSLSEDLGTFDLTGVSIENIGGGLIYHNLGVGGSTFGSLLAQAYFDEEITFISPDVVILDWGTNDIIYKNTVPDTMKEIVTKTVARVRAASPQAVIVLTSLQDMNFRGHNITVTHKFSQLMRKWAAQNDCLFYDWYRVSGGADSMNWWYSYGLAGKDQIHLTSLGYRIKGELMAQALVNSLQGLKSTSLINHELWITDPANNHPQSVVSWLKFAEPYRRRIDPIIAKAKLRHGNLKNHMQLASRKKRSKVASTKSSAIRAGLGRTSLKKK